MNARRFPRKAKKWAKKNGANLISVSGRRFWYTRTYTYGTFRVGTP